DVGITIPHQVGTLKVQVQVAGGPEDKFRIGFATGAAGARMVGADVEAVQSGPPLGQELTEVALHLFQEGQGEIAPGCPGLVADDHYLQARLIEAADGRGRLGEDPEAAQMVDIAHLFVDGAVPVQKYRGVAHFFRLPFSAYCLLLTGSVSQGRAADKTSSTPMAVRQAYPRLQVRRQQGLQGRGRRSTVARGVKGPVAAGSVEPNRATRGTPRAAAACIRPESLVTSKFKWLKTARAWRKSVLLARSRTGRPNCAFTRLATGASPGPPSSTRRAP